MKSESTKISMHPTTANDDLSDPNNLRAMHSIEAILGFKKAEHIQFHPTTTKKSNSKLISNKKQTKQLIRLF